MRRRDFTYLEILIPRWAFRVGLAICILLWVVMTTLTHLHFSSNSRPSESDAPDARAEQRQLASVFF